MLDENTKARKRGGRLLLVKTRDGKNGNCNTLSNF